MGILKDLETLILSADQLNDEGVPSVSLALLENGKIANHVITKGGENTDTLYQACSISKAMTAVAIAKLIDQGLISYDTRIIDLLPPEVLAPIIDIRTEHLLQYVTVGLLASHRSGISQDGFRGYTDQTPSYDEIIAGIFPANNPRLRFKSFPGSQFSYSGGGYVLLQILLEQVSGLAFADFMQQTVLAPLGMTRSLFGNLPPHEQNFARAYVNAYAPGTDAVQGYHRFAELAAAGLWSTPTDLLRAVSAIQYSLHHDDGFLSQPTAKRMLTSVAPNHPLRSMAMGWGADDTYFAHRGENEPGYHCYVLGAHGGAVNRSAAAGPPTPPGFNAASNTLDGGLAIMTNSTAGWKVIRQLTAALFAFRHACRRPFLPAGFGSMDDIIPYPVPHDLHFDYMFAEWTGRWAGGWEVCLDEGYLEIAFDGIDAPMRLRGGILPAPFPKFGLAPRCPGPREQMLAATWVVPGLDFAVRFSERGGEKVLEIIQDEIQIVRRV